MYHILLYIYRRKRVFLYACASEGWVADRSLQRVQLAKIFHVHRRVSCTESYRFVICYQCQLFIIKCTKKWRWTWALVTGNFVQKLFLPYSFIDRLNLFLNRTSFSCRSVFVIFFYRSVATRGLFYRGNISPLQRHYKRHHFIISFRGLIRCSRGEAISPSMGNSLGCFLRDLGLVAYDCT